MVFFQSLFFVLTPIRCPFHPGVTACVRKRPRSFGQKCRWQVTFRHAYTYDPTKSDWAVWAHTQLVKERSSTVVSARWPAMDWSLLKEYSWCVRADLHLKRKVQAGTDSSKLPPNRGKSHHQVVRKTIKSKKKTVRMVGCKNTRLKYLLYLSLLFISIQYNETCNRKQLI